MSARALLLLVGVFACSTAAILLKASHTHPAVVAAVRLILASILLSPLAIRDARRARGLYTSAHLRRCILPAAVLSAHFISWATGARLTLSAQASLIVNLVPVAIPFFLHALVGERINRLEILGTTLALTGLVVVSIRDVWRGTGQFTGNLACFVAMLFFAWYLALGRRNRDFPSLWLYVVPVYAFAGVFSAIAAIPWWRTFAVGSTREWLLIAGLTVGPTILGHSLLNYAIRHFRGQIVSLANVGQFIFAAIMAYFFFGEVPPATFYIASALVLAGVGLVLFNAPTAPPRLR